MKMNSVEVIKTWWNSLVKTNKTIKLLEKKKLTFKDGAVSLAWISAIISVLFTIVVWIGGAKTQLINSTGLVGVLVGSFVVTFIASIIGLWIFTWVFTKIAKKHKGKAKFGKIAGFYGIFAGALMLSFIPYAIGYLLMMLFKTIPIIGFSFLGLGMLIYGAYAGKVAGMLFEYLSDIEKIKVNEIGWIQGLTIGIIYLVGIVILGFAAQLMI